MNIVEFLRLIKNLRGVVTYNPKKPPNSRLINWLISKHHYRNIGIPDSLFNEKFEAKPFCKLFYPHKSFERLIKQLKDFSPFLSDSIISSLVYGCPLYILEQDIFKDLESIMIWQLKVTSLLAPTELLRNIRICGYAVIDFYESTVEESFDLIKQYLDKQVPLSRIKVLLGKREEVGIKDAKSRFWRISSEKQGYTILAYFDLLKVLIKYPELLEIFKETDYAKLLLGIVCGILIY